jgi:hypothetical protein
MSSRNQPQHCLRKQPISTVQPRRFGAARTVPELPVRYLRVLSQYGVVLCRDHQSCHSLSSIKRHLRSKHRAGSLELRGIMAWIDTQGIAIVVSHPPDHSPPIPYLMKQKGFLCKCGPCRFRTTSELAAKRHCHNVHGVDSHGQQQPNLPYAQVTLQALFAKGPEYFIVSVDDILPAPTTSPPSPATPNRKPPWTFRHQQAVDNGFSSAAWAIGCKPPSGRSSRNRGPNVLGSDVETSPLLQKSRSLRDFAQDGLGFIAKSAIKVGTNIRRSARLRRKSTQLCTTGISKVGQKFVRGPTLGKV